MRICGLKRKAIPKIAVLATGLAVALLAATIHPAPAQASPDYASNCTECHSAGGSVLATPSLATVAPGAAYTVSLAFTGGGGPVGYWISGNGANVTGSSTTAAMTAPAAAGPYTYTVWMRNGVASSTTYSITVAAADPVGVAPVASFTASATSGTAPLPVTMTDTSTGDTPMTWLWDFGNGTTSTGQNPSVTYASAGTYAVSLTAKNASGENTSATQTITVTAADPGVVAPLASFTSVISATDPLSVAMTDTSTGVPTSWSWDMGNGTTSTEQSPSVTYASAGTYDVSLTATNAGGSDTSATQSITVGAPTGPSAAVITSLSPRHGKVGTKVTIKGSGFGALGVVQFGTVVPTASSWTETEIVFKVPAGNVGRVALVTVTPGIETASNAVKFRLDRSKKGHHSFRGGHYFGHDHSFGYAPSHHSRLGGDLD